MTKSATIKSLLYYDAEGFAITLGGERYGPISPLRALLLDAICDSRSKPDRAETVKQGSVHESDGAGTAIAQPQSGEAA